MEEQLLKKLQKTEYEMLIEIDDYCVKHCIQYSLYAGTLLGAVRHGGFIPWDDDMDIVMTRSNYKKFCNCFEKHPISGMYFQHFENDTYCDTCHGKIRKNDTILLSEGEDEKKGHHGVWIDVFPIDKLSNQDKKKNESIKWGKQIIILTKANVSKGNDPIKKKLQRLIIGFIPSALRHMALRRASNKLNIIDSIIKDNYTWHSMSTMTNIERYSFPSSLTEEYTTIRFYEHEFMVFKDYKKLLHILYDDYMILPPKEKQICTHNPIKVKL